MYEDATYEYKLCLFQNITQKKRFNSNEAYLLGVWGGWVGDGHSTMKLKDGTACSSTVDRSTTVEVVRAEAPSPNGDGSDSDEPWRSWPVTKITSVSEPTPCEYLVQLEYAFPEDLEGEMGSSNSNENGDIPNSSDEVADHNVESSGDPAEDLGSLMGEDTISHGTNSAEPNNMVSTELELSAADAGPSVPEQHSFDQASSSDSDSNDEGTEDLIAAEGGNVLAPPVPDHDNSLSSGDYEYVEGVWVLSEPSSGSNEASSDAVESPRGDAVSSAQVFGNGEMPSSTATQNDCVTTDDATPVHVKLDAMANELREMKALLKQVVEGQGSKLDDLLKAIELAEL